MQLSFASALLHIVFSGNNAATVHFSQCDKQAENIKSFSLRKTRGVIDRDGMYLTFLPSSAACAYPRVRFFCIS